MGKYENRWDACGRFEAGYDRVVAAVGVGSQADADTDTDAVVGGRGGGRSGMGWDGIGVDD